MTNQISTNSSGSLIEQIIVRGDLSALSPQQRAEYAVKVCESVGLNPLTKPFDYISLQGKLTLYAKRDATDQLRKIHNVSVKITSREKQQDIYVVTARASMPGGREDESIGAVTVGNLKGDMLANAVMKAETKAKRRVTLSICGLGLLDETEVETVNDKESEAKPSQKTTADLNSNDLDKLKGTAEAHDWRLNDLRYYMKCKYGTDVLSAYSREQFDELIRTLEMSSYEAATAKLTENDGRMK
jgi:hypothetical protein